MTSFFPSAFPTGGFYESFFDPFADMDMEFDIMPELAPDYSGRLLTGAGAGGRRAGDGPQGGAGSRRQRRAADQASRQQWQHRARVNLAQEEDRYCVCVEVPGRTREDLCVSLEGNILKVCGKALLPEEDEQEERESEAEKRPQQQQPQQPLPIQGEGQPAGGAQQAESKEAELSGGEKAREREGRAEESRPQPQERKQQRRFLIREFPIGRIERSVRLPADAAEEGICAKCEHGLLQICVPRLPKKRPVEIK